MTVEQALREHPFTKHLSPELLTLLQPLAALRRYQPGELLLREGAPAESFVLLLEGLAAVELDTPGPGALRLQTLGPDQVAGWSWFFPPYLGCFDIVAVEPVDAVVFDGPKLRAAMEQHPELGYAVSKNLLAMVAGRLQATRVRLLDLYRPGGGS